MPRYSKFYALRGHEVVEAGDLMGAARMFEAGVDRTVAKTTLTDPKDATKSCEVSTVFLPIDHNYSNEGPPLVFETLIFEGPLADWMNRYSTWEDAEKGHAEFVEAVRIAYAMPEKIKQVEAKLVRHMKARKSWHDLVLDNADED